MRHKTIAGEIFTTEEWLAEWLAADAVKQLNWPMQNYDPLEDIVGSRVIHMIGFLVSTGVLGVMPTCAIEQPQERESALIAETL